MYFANAGRKMYIMLPAGCTSCRRKRRYEVPNRSKVWYIIKRLPLYIITGIVRV